MTISSLHYFVAVAVVATVLNLLAGRLLKTKNFCEVGLEMGAIVAVLAIGSAAILAMIGATAPDSVWGHHASDTFFQYAILNLVSLAIGISIEVLVVCIGALALSPFSKTCHQFAWRPAH